MKFDVSESCVNRMESLFQNINKRQTDEIFEDAQFYNKQEKADTEIKTCNFSSETKTARKLLNRQRVCFLDLYLL